MFDCFAGALSTGALAYMLRRTLSSYMLRNSDMLAVLQKRGFDVEDHAMDAYLQKTYHKGDKLGEGVSGCVWKVTHRRNREQYAMKQIKKKKGGLAEKGLETEIKCLRKLQHRHIVNIVDSVESSQHLWIIMECAEGGGLYDRIVKLSHFSERSAAHVMKQVLKAVHYMHSYGVVHRDLKPENILLMTEEENSIVKVADFGLAVILDRGLQGYRIDESMRMKANSDIKEGFCGSPICMAPEVAKSDAAYGPQCDMWSVGCITFELLSGSPPFDAPTASELFHLLQCVSGPTFSGFLWRQISKDAKNLVISMLKHHPEDRVSAREALQHNWFHTAPDTHNAVAQEAIMRRLTSETSFATSLAYLPGSHFSCGTRSTMHTQISRGTRSTVRTLLPVDDDDGDEDGDGTCSDQVSHEGNSRETNRGTIKGSMQLGNDLESSLESKASVEGKVFQIARGGLQAAAWPRNAAVSEHKTRLASSA
jgi:serine/threonine protein kinase